MIRAVMAAVLVLIGMAGPARSQIPVTDGALISTETIAHAKSLLQDLRSYARDLQSLQQEIQMVTSTGQLVASTIQHPSIGAAMQLAGIAGIDLDLPVNPYSAMSLTSGYGGGVAGLTGKLSSLGSLVNGSWQRDSVAVCQDNSYACQQSQAYARSNAGAKGLIGQLYKQTADHLPILQALRQRAETATTPAERENIMEQIQLENTWSQHASNQMQGVVALASVQKEVHQVQVHERLTSDADAVLASAPR